MSWKCATTRSVRTAKAHPAAPSVDVYALGAVGCYLLTGKHIFDATAALEFVTYHLTQEPIAPSSRDPSVPKDLEDVLLACLAKDPEERVPSVVEMRRRLLACADANRWSQDDAAAWWKARREKAAAVPSTT